MSEERRLWGVLWRQKNKMYGLKEHLDNENCVPILFSTRAEAGEWIKKRYGYIATRKDLRAEPHGWLMPRPVRVLVRMMVQREAEHE